ncbi:MAG: 50S ribosomal protein L35 [bacterium]
MKTNKSFTKRLKVTRRGKVIGRVAGQGHFNSKESRRSQLAKKRTVAVKFKNKDLGRFLSNA